MHVFVLRARAAACIFAVCPVLLARPCCVTHVASVPVIGRALLTAISARVLWLSPLPSCFGAWRWGVHPGVEHVGAERWSAGAQHYRTRAYTLVHPRRQLQIGAGRWRCQRKASKAKEASLSNASCTSGRLPRRTLGRTRTASRGSWRSAELTRPRRGGRSWKCFGTPPSVEPMRSSTEQGLLIVPSIAKIMASSISSSRVGTGSPGT